MPYSEDYRLAITLALAFCTAHSPASSTAIVQESEGTSDAVYSALGWHFSTQRAHR